MNYRGCKEPDDDAHRGGMALAISFESHTNKCSIMEQQAFYIVFAIVGMAIVGIVSWAVSYSSRNDYDDYYRSRGGYPPPYPQYPPPYYPQPYPPQRESPIVTILGIGLVVFTIFAGMQYCDRTKEQDRLEQIYKEEDNIVEQDDRSLSPTNIYSGDATYDEIDNALPESYDLTPIVVSPSVSPTVSLSDGYFCQKYASGDPEQILQDAKKREATFPGQVFIGEHLNDDTGYPYKLLIGPYSTEEAAQSAHGRNAVVYRPAEKGIQIYNPR
jgi:hypothetical protein